jgi:hypothetical protein
VKYMCMECRRIYELHSFAQECCQPRVESIEDDRVSPCERGGETCEDEGCVFCQGTGLMMKPAEKGAAG